jgi:hypothetical protein
MALAHEPAHEASSQTSIPIGSKNSEVARLMQRIQQEYEAAQRALNDTAYGTARHDFISRRLENVGSCQQALQAMVGEQEGARLTATAIEQVGE